MLQGANQHNQAGSRKLSADWMDQHSMSFDQYNNEKSHMSNTNKTAFTSNNLNLGLDKKRDIKAEDKLNS